MEKQNVERFVLLSEGDYLAKDLAIKGATPRSHEDTKKHWTDAQGAAQVTGHEQFGISMLENLWRGTPLNSKSLLVLYNRYPYHGNVELATITMQNNPEYKGPRLAALGICPDTKAVNFARQQLHKRLFEVLV